MAKLTREQKVEIYEKRKKDKQYHPGYIPGCEPRYSGPCNAGWWEVIFEKS